MLVCIYVTCIVGWVDDKTLNSTINGGSLLALLFDTSLCSLLCSFYGVHSLPVEDVAVSDVLL